MNKNFFTVFFMLFSLYANAVTNNSMTKEIVLLQKAKDKAIEINNQKEVIQEQENKKEEAKDKAIEEIKDKAKDEALKKIRNKNH